jgi:hypothetical protein
MRSLLKMSKTKVVILVLVVALIIFRAVLPSIILSRLNNYLAEFSPVYSIHIGNLDLGLLTFSYTGHNAEAFYKKDGHRFFVVKKTRVQISFSELLHGRILTNVRVDDAKFVLTKALFKGSKDPDAKPKETAKKASEKMFPLRIAYVEVHDGDFDFADFVDQDKDMRWRVTDIEAKVLNINPLPENPYTTFDLHGKFLDSSPFKLTGKAKRLETPIAWKTDFEMKDFDMVIANPMLLKDLPLTFTKGKLDLYSEVKSEHGQISGYVKPFLKNAAVLKNEKYVSVKHFLNEILSAFANWLLQNSNGVTATKISFHEEGGHLKVDTGKAIQKAIENKLEKPLTPGTDDSVPFM